MSSASQDPPPTAPRAASGWEQAEDGTIRFVATGELDRAVRVGLAEALHARTPGAVARAEIDLGAVTFLDVAAARLFERYRMAAAECGADVRIVNTTPVQRQILAVVGRSPQPDDPARGDSARGALADLFDVSRELTAEAHRLVTAARALCSESARDGPRHPRH